MHLEAHDIKAIAKVVHDLCGVVLDESKDYLIQGRLGKIAEQAGCRTFSELCTQLRGGTDPSLCSAVVDAITTNETLFFRDKSPFVALSNRVLPDLIDMKAGTPAARRLRIWSAACSTGQEPYSLAITLSEMIPNIHAWDVSILGTDISDTAVRYASLGHYQQREVDRGVPSDILGKYFIRTSDGFRVCDELRALCSFRRLNLLDPLHGLGPFDVVFCRNVAIYFSTEAKRDLFERITRALYPHGYLFVGSSESLSDLGPRFTAQHHCRASYYQPNLTQSVSAS